MPALKISPSKFTVAICGGGLGGLTLAIALQKFSNDIHVDLYESAAMFTQIGAGVGVWRRPWKVMKNLGLTGELSRLTRAPEDEEQPRVAFQMRKSDQEVGIPSFDMISPMGSLLFHRADLQEALCGQIDHSKTTPYFSKRLTHYVQGHDGIRLSFKDGSNATCDVLVGADGIHSATRHCLLKETAQEISESDPARAEELLRMLEPEWSGSIAYRAVIDGERLKLLNPEHNALKEAQNYMGKDKHLIVYPILHNGKRMVNIVAFCSWPEKEGTAYSGSSINTCDIAEVFQQYAGWETEVQQLIQCIETPTKWAINQLKGLPISAHGRVALLGDAAHAMTPHQLSGAGQAIEDAYILARILAHPKVSLATVSAALKVYEAVRLPHGNDIHRRSRENGRLYEFIDPPHVEGMHVVSTPAQVENGSEKDSTPAGRPFHVNGFEPGSPEELAWLKQIGITVTENWSWAWKTDIDDDFARAIILLEERLV